jgi:membrane-associated phospholipid phosphatase
VGSFHDWEIAVVHRIQQSLFAREPLELNETPPIDPAGRKMAEVIVKETRRMRRVQMLTFLGTPLIMSAAGIILLLIGLISGNWVLLRTYIGCIAFSSLMMETTRRVIRRPRPYITISYIYCLDKTAHNYSFPSGHSLYCTLVAQFFLVFYNAPGIWMMLPIIYGSAIGLTRVALGAHYLSDTTMGVLFGVLLPLLYFAFIADLWTVFWHCVF